MVWWLTAGPGLLQRGCCLPLELLKQELGFHLLGSVWFHRGSQGRASPAPPPHGWAPGLGAAAGQTRHLSKLGAGRDGHLASMPLHPGLC